MTLPDVYPLTDFRQHTADHLKRLKKSDRPTLLTQNGKTAAVVLSEALYEQLLTEAELGHSLSALQESLGDTRPDIPFKKVAARLRAKYINRSGMKRTPTSRAT